MNKVIISTILVILICFPCFAETITTHVDGHGRTVYTNSGTSSSRGDESTKEEISTTVTAITLRHPEFDDTRIDKMIRLRDHFISFGNPPHLALLKAEKKMIGDGDLIDHEAIAKIQREEEERLKIEKQKVEELSEKNAKRQRATKNSYSATEGGDAHTKNFQQGSYGTSYAPAAGGRVDIQTGGFQQRAAGGYVDTRTGTFHQDAAGGTVNTQTGAFTPGN